MKPLKLSNLVNTVGTKASNEELLRYLRDLDNDLQRLYESFYSMISLNQLKVGSSSNYVSVDTQGTLSFVGSSVSGTTSASVSTGSITITHGGITRKLHVFP